MDRTTAKKNRSPQAGRGSRERSTMSDGEDQDLQQNGEQSATAVEEPASNGRGQASGLAGAATIRPCPIPAGAVIFGELTSAFVDGPRLLRFLGDRHHTGAVVDSSGGRVQVAVLCDGAVVGLISAGSEGSRRLDGLSLPAPGGGDEHQLTVLTYRNEVSVALGQLINLPERFDRMHGSFVDLPALLTFLGRESASGAVRITTRDDTGVVLLRQGNVLGAYTSQKPELDDAEVVYSLAKAPDAEIDVHVGALSIPPASIPVTSAVR